MTIVLGFDTSTADTVVAVAEGSETLAATRIAPEQGRPRHATTLLGAIEQCVHEAGGWSRVDRIAVGAGPGTFTGLRIGIVTARGLAAAHGIEITSVSSLDALAASAARRYVDRGLLAMIDARRGEVFALARRPDGSGKGPACLGPSQLPGFVAGPGPILCCGDGSVRFRQEIEALGGFEVPPDSDEVHRIDAREVCGLGAESQPVDLHSITPNYLREPDAKRWIARDQPDDSG